MESYLYLSVCAKSIRELVYSLHKSHKANLCLHKETTCHYCHKVGHLKKVCRKLKQVEKAAGPSLVKQVEVTSPEPLESEYPLFQIGKLHSTPITVEVLLDDHPLIMEIDTGAAVSVISQCSYQQLLGQGQLRALLLT